MTDINNKYLTWLDNQVEKAETFNERVAYTAARNKYIQIGEQKLRPNSNPTSYRAYREKALFNIDNKENLCISSYHHTPLVSLS